MTQVKLMYSIFLICVAMRVSAQELYSTENLRIEKVAENTYVHISYLKTEEYGNVPCNGMVVVSNNEVIVYDTPTDNDSSLELIKWIENNLRGTIRAVVPTHFHADCLGGLGAFHSKGIPSQASNLTIELATANNSHIPQEGFDEYYEHTIGKEVVISDFVGTGHTKDNIIGYFPKDQVLFGGCLIKSLKAGKGNLEDATPEVWSETVKKLKAKYKDVKIVIPGHGRIGGLELLNYTIEKFGKN